MTTITLTAGSEEELVCRAAEARAAVAGTLQRLVTALRDGLPAGHITLDLTSPDLSITPHDIHINADGTITATVRSNVNAHLDIKVDTGHDVHDLPHIICELDEDRRPLFLWAGQSYQDPEQAAALVAAAVDRVLARDRRLQRAQRIAEALQPVLSGPPAEAR
jgi:hypothetical protein